MKIRQSAAHHRPTLTAVFALSLLLPGTYQMTVTEDGYSQGELTSVQVPVTESIRVSIAMKVAGITQAIEVKSHAFSLQSDTVALDAWSMRARSKHLPLASLNFTQIVDLSRSDGCEQCCGIGAWWERFGAD